MSDPYLPLEPLPPIALSVAMDIITRMGRGRRLLVVECAPPDALQRVLATACCTAVDQPPVNLAAVDGIALRSAELPLHGHRLQLADPAMLAASNMRVTGHGVYVAAGTALPFDCDSVAPMDAVSLEGDIAIIARELKPGTGVHRAGASARRGQPLLPEGQRLAPRHLAVLAAAGIEKAPVRRAPRISVLHADSEPDSINSTAALLLVAQTTAAGSALVRNERLPADPAHWLPTLRAATATSDIVLVAGGGANVTGADLSRLLTTHGRIHFWRVLMQPGANVLLGEMDGCMIFGVPDEPFSALVIFHVLVRHALDALEGAQSGPRVLARLRTGLTKHERRAEFVHGRLRVDAEGTTWFFPHARQASAQVADWASSDALALLNQDIRNPAAGSLCRVWPLTDGC